MARDTKALTDECEFFDEPDDSTKMAALRTICAHAKDAQDALELASMLGVHPSQLTEGDAMVTVPAKFT